jgi:Kef-type K+ transport system membrane component KefB
MPHETSLIATLALSLIAALIGALAASRLRMPSLVGYLLGGVLIGPAHQSPSNFHQRPPAINQIRMFMMLARKPNLHQVLSST